MEPSYQTLSDTAAGQGVRMIPKIKFEHISLIFFINDEGGTGNLIDTLATLMWNSHASNCLCTTSRFSVNLCRKLSLTGGEEATETAYFMGMVDKLFDCLNVHNYVHGIHSRTFFQMAYASAADSQHKVYNDICIK